MKTKILMLSLAMLACDGNDPGEDAAVYGYFFQLRTVHEGKDVEFFSVNPAYDYHSFTVKDFDHGSLAFDAKNLIYISDMDSIDLTDFFNKTKSFYIGSVFLTQYLDYGNGDVDTLTQTSKPSNGGFLAHNPDSVFFYLNGKLKFKYGYKANLDNLRTKNNPVAFRQTIDQFNPMIFTIHKTAEK